MMDGRKFLDWFNRAIEPLRNRVVLMINRGSVDSVNDSGSFQTNKLKVLAGETKNAVPVFHHFGFTSSAPADSDVIMICINGNRENSVVIGSENRTSRFKDVGAGNAAIYNQAGKHVHLKGDNLDILLEKMIINNSQYEFVAVISEWMEEVEQGLTLTAIGPQPWITSTRAKLLAVKAKLDTFKE